MARLREPLAVVAVASEDDVAHVLRWARREGARVSPRSGGHSFDGFPVQPNTVLLDLSALDAAQLDASGIAHAQPGARTEKIAQTFAPSGRALPTGDCGTVALGGLLSGGGFGFASRKLGLTMDSVAEATVVTGKGDVLRVTPERHPDLFWACCGGGGTACIVVEFMIRSFLVGEVTGFGLSLRWDHAREVIQQFDALLSGAPDEFDIKLKIRTTGKGRYLDATVDGPDDCVAGIPSVHIDGQYLGRRAEAEALLAPLLDHPAMLDATIREENYFDAVLQLLPLPTLDNPSPATLNPHRVSSDFISGHLGPSEADAIVRFIEELQYSQDLWGGAVLFEPCDRAVHARTPDDSPFPHRDSLLLGEWELIYPLHPTAEEWSRLDRLLGGFRSQMGDVLSGGRYVNYPDSLDGPRHWWGTNEARLRKAAATYDPDRVIVSRLHPASP